MIAELYIYLTYNFHSTTMTHNVEVFMKLWHSKNVSFN